VVVKTAGERRFRAALSERVFVPHAMLGLFAGDSRLLFLLMAVIWTTNHEPQAVRRTGLARIKSSD